VNVRKAIRAGFAGTAVMTVVMMLAPTMGLPKMDIAAMLGSMFASTSPVSGSAAWFAGFAMHLMVGTVVLSIGYALLSTKLRVRSALAKGIAYGGVVWLIAQSMVMPMMGAGLFSSHLPSGAMITVGSLMGHLTGSAGWHLRVSGIREVGWQPLHIEVLSAQ